MTVIKSLENDVVEVAEGDVAVVLSRKEAVRLAAITYFMNWSENGKLGKFAGELHQQLEHLDSDKINDYVHSRQIDLPNSSIVGATIVKKMKD